MAEVTTRIYEEDLQFVKVQAAKRGVKITANVTIPQMLNKILKDYKKYKQIK